MKEVTAFMDRHAGDLTGMRIIIIGSDLFSIELSKALEKVFGTEVALLKSVDEGAIEEAMNNGDVDVIINATMDDLDLKVPAWVRLIDIRNECLEPIIPEVKTSSGHDHNHHECNCSHHD